MDPNVIPRALGSRASTGVGPCAGASVAAPTIPAAEASDRATKASRRYRFLGYRVDPALRRLTFAGRPIALQAKAFHVILYLIEHRTRAVARDELIKAVWGRADVADAALAEAVLMARRALNDVGCEQIIIQTVFRYGYQWIAPVEMELCILIPDERLRAEANSISATSGAFGLWGLLGLAVMLLSAVAIGVFVMRS
jgi:DNA-binding winged helix-turn-helix (wHTH) protein